MLRFMSLSYRGLPEHRRRELDAGIPGTAEHQIRSSLDAMVSRINMADVVMEMWTKAQEKMDLAGMYPYLCPTTTRGMFPFQNERAWRDAVDADKASRFQAEFRNAPFVQVYPPADKTG